MLYTVRLGDTTNDVPLRGRLVGEILENLDAGVKKALRMCVEGRSEISGTYPRSLARGVEFDVHSVDREHSAIILEAPILTDVLFDKDVLEEVPPNKSAIGLFTEGLRDAIEHREMSELVDESMISTFVEFERAVDKAGSITFTNGKAGAKPVVLRDSTLHQIRTYQVDKPISRLTRVAGKLNTIRHSDGAFTLTLASGASLKGTFVGTDIAAMKKYWGRMVIASGRVHFRSSGRAASIEATHVIDASPEQIAEWADDPTPLEGAGSTRIKQVRQGSRSGMNAFFGKLPFEVSDEEILRVTEGK